MIYTLQYESGMVVKRFVKGFSKITKPETSCSSVDRWMVAAKVTAGFNFNNEVFCFYNGSPQYVAQREYYHPTYAGGLRWASSREK